ncbi:MAG: MED6 mediator sub complex component-domain-containing protein [Benniella sp.]|nr:MAG: MED6 mediator sub complex component-domain-containing protein [Benniella sp.]
MAAQVGAPGNSNAEQNLLNMEWRFHEWILGVGGLNPDNVLDYFALSPFWDPECNNAVLRMQTQFNNLGEMKQRLSEMTGVEFALVHDRYPTLFVIQKQRRRSPQEVKPMAIYYVLHGSIYQCPDLQTLLSNRILGSLHHVESAFNEARSMTEFHPSSGYRWKSLTTEDPSSTSSITTSTAATGAGAGATVAGGGGGTSGAPPSTTISATSAADAGAPKPGAALSQDFMMAVDRAIKNVDQRAQMQQFKLQSGNAAAAAAAANGSAALNPGGGGITIAGNGLDPKVKQEGVGVGVGSSSSSSAAAAAAARNTPKAANKRRKKSEEASVAAANMGVNSTMGINPTQGRSPTTAAGGGGGVGMGGMQPLVGMHGGVPPLITAASAIGGPGVTAAANVTKRRKKTKTSETK